MIQTITNINKNPTGLCVHVYRGIYALLLTRNVNYRVNLFYQDVKLEGPWNLIYPQKITPMKKNEERRTPLIITTRLLALYIEGPHLHEWDEIIKEKQKSRRATLSLLVYAHYN
jgi:hypothetical protein